MNVNRVVTSFKEYDVAKIKTTKPWDAWQGVCEQIMSIHHHGSALSELDRQNFQKRLRALFRETQEASPGVSDTADLVMALEMKGNSGQSTGAAQILDTQAASRESLMQTLSTLNTIGQIVKNAVAADAKPSASVATADRSGGFLSAAATSQVLGSKAPSHNTTQVTLSADLNRQVKDVLRSMDSDGDPAHQVQDLLKHPGPLQDMFHHIAELRQKVGELEEM